jgi:hypothetical protein
MYMLSAVHLCICAETLHTGYYPFDASVRCSRTAVFFRPFEPIKVFKAIIINFNAVLKKSNNEYLKDLTKVLQKIFYVG